MKVATAPDRSPRRARKFAAKRESVLDAAMQLVIAEGLAGLTLGKVAKGLDVAVGGLYRYFPSKDALVAGLQCRAVERFGARLDARVPPAAAARGPVALLRHAAAPFEFYAQHADEAPDEHRLMDVMLSSLDPSLGDARAREVEVVLEPILGRAQQGLEAAADAGALSNGDGRQRTLVLWAATHGVGHLRSRDRLEASPYRAHALLTALLETMLVGFGASRRNASAALRHRAATEAK